MRVVAPIVCVLLSASPSLAGLSILGQQDYADGAVVTSDATWLAAQAGEPSPFSTVWQPGPAEWTHAGLPTTGPGELTFSVWDIDSDVDGNQIGEFLFDGEPQSVNVFEAPPVPDITVKVYRLHVPSSYLHDGTLVVTLSATGGNAWGIDFSSLDVVDPTAVPSGDGAAVVELSAPSQNPVSSSVAFQIVTLSPTGVEMRVCDVSGRLISALVSGSLSQGSHQVVWGLNDGVGRRVAAGQYFVLLQADGKTLSRRVTVVR